MSVRIVHKRNLPRSKPARAIHYAAEKHEADVYAGFYRAITTAQRQFKTEEIVAALKRNAPEIAVAAMPWAEFERGLESGLMLPLKNAVADGAAAAVKALAKRIEKGGEPNPTPRPTNFQVGADISFTLDNPRTQSYLARYAGRLVTRIKNETMLAIRRVTTDAHARGENVSQQADKIAAALKRDMGLNQRQAGALGKYQQSLEAEELPQAQIDRQVADYRDRLIDQRARVIARHETLTGSSEGQHEVWRQATEQGLLDPASTKRKLLTQPPINGNNPCPICRPYNGEIRGLGEAFTIGMQPPFHIGCLAPDTLVTPRGRIVAVSKRWVDDYLTVIQCADSLPLSCTPNHPVLTRRGWVAAGALNVGDEVANPGVGQRVGLGDGQDVDAPARAEDIAETFFARSSVVTREVPVSAPDFHGDGAQSDIAIVAADCLLLNRREAVCPHGFHQGDLSGRGVSDVLLPADGVHDALGLGWDATSSGGMGGTELGGSLLWVGASAPDDGLGFTRPSDWDTHLLQAIVDNDALGTIMGGELLNGPQIVYVQAPQFIERQSDARPAPMLSIQGNSGFAQDAVHDGLGATEHRAELSDGVLARMVEPQDIVFRKLDAVSRHRHAGWVYNFQTDQNYYIADGYATHNCECTVVLVFED